MEHVQAASASNGGTAVDLLVTAQGSARNPRAERIKAAGLIGLGDTGTSDSLPSCSIRARVVTGRSGRRTPTSGTPISAQPGEGNRPVQEPECSAPPTLPPSTGRGEHPGRPDPSASRTRMRRDANVVLGRSGGDRQDGVGSQSSMERNASTIPFRVTSLKNCTSSIGV